MKLKLKPFGTGLFDPSYNQTTSLTSSSMKSDIRLKLTSEDRDLKCIEPNLIPKSIVAINLSSNNFFASLQTILGSSLY